MLEFLLIGLIGFVFLMAGLANVCDGGIKKFLSLFLGIILIMLATYGMAYVTIIDDVKTNVVKLLISEKKINIVIDESNKISYELQDSTMVNTFEYLNNGY